MQQPNEHQARDQFPTAGNCEISLSNFLVYYLEEGRKVEPFLDLLMQGKLDVAGRTYKINTNEKYGLSNPVQRLDIPTWLPQIQGDVTWRKKHQLWYLDVSILRINKETRWEEQIKGSEYDGCLSVSGVFPDALKTKAIGEKAKDIIEASFLDDNSIIKKIKTNPGREETKFLSAVPPTIYFYMDCGRSEFRC